MSQAVQVKWHGDKVKAVTRSGAVNGLFRAAEHLLEVSNRFVPLQEGILQDTGATSVDKGALRAAVSYDTSYAVKQHEEMDYQHAAGRTAKYLENPMNSERATIIKILGGGVADAWDAGREMVQYTSKAGKTSTITRAQAANYSRNRKS
jgi:hypothetical protein